MSESGSPQSQQHEGTPIAGKPTSFEPFITTRTRGEDRKAAIQSEITGCVVGPVNAEKFLDKYLPTMPARRLPAFVKEISALQKKMNQISRESPMYDIWTTTFSHYCQNARRSPGDEPRESPVCSWSLLNSSIRAATDFCGLEIKPDIGLYPTEATSIQEFPKHKIIENVEIFHECKFKPKDDAFQDIGESFERHTIDARQTLGQIALYATAQMAAQFRTHIFALLIFPGYARLLRWDRAGVVVTEQIMYDKKCIIPHFYWRYCHASAAERGLDTSVQPFSGGSNKIRRLLNLEEGDTLFRMSLGVGKGTYIIGKPTYMGVFSPTGRSTRTFNAVNENDEEEVVFLKDTWRVTEREREHEIYETLHQNKVRHIPTVKEGTDILQHETITNTAATGWFQGRSFPRIRKFRHYRIVLEEVGHDLREVGSVRELVTSICDAAEAHEDAYRKAGILHRDVSVQNICLLDDGKGLLIDWDMSVSTQLPAPNVRHAVEHTAAWQFVAARLLLGQAVQHEREDDLESFYHVLNWMALRYTSHTMNTEDLVHNLERIFNNSYRSHEGAPRGGWAKRDALLTGLTNRDAGFQNPPLKELLETIRTLVAVRYGSPEDDLKVELEKPYHFLSLFRRALEVNQWEIKSNIIDHLQEGSGSEAGRGDSDGGSGAGDEGSGTGASGGGSGAGGAGEGSGAGDEGSGTGASGGGSGAGGAGEGSGAGDEGSGTGASGGGSGAGGAGEGSGVGDEGSGTGASGGGSGAGGAGEGSGAGDEGSGTGGGDPNGGIGVSSGDSDWDSDGGLEYI